MAPKKPQGKAAAKPKAAAKKQAQPAKPASKPSKQQPKAAPKKAEKSKALAPVKKDLKPAKTKPKPAAKAKPPAKASKQGKGAKAKPAKQAKLTKAAKTAAKIVARAGGAKTEVKHKIEPKKAEKASKKRKVSALFVPRKRNFAIGQDLRPRHDVTRFVRWPVYIKRQRQKRVLMRRLKVPPAINQFRHPVDRITKKALFKLAQKYKPETRKQKRARIQKAAQAKVKGVKDAKGAKRPELKYGLKRVTRLIETKRAKLVMIAHDVDPVELVLVLPALCKKLEVPYCIVRSKATLGKLVGYKRCSCCCWLTVRHEDQEPMKKLVEAVKTAYNDRYDEIRKQWGGLQLGKRHALNMARKKKAT